MSWAFPRGPWTSRPTAGRFSTTTMSEEGAEIVLRAIDSTEDTGSRKRPLAVLFSGWTVHRIRFDVGRASEKTGGGRKPLSRSRVARPCSLGRDWGPDDYIYLPKNYVSEIYRVPASGGELEPVTVLAEGEAAHWWPHVLPKGKTLLYTVVRGNGGISDPRTGPGIGKIERRYRFGLQRAVPHLRAHPVRPLWLALGDSVRLERRTVTGPPAEVRSSVYTDVNNANLGAAVSATAPWSMPKEKATGRWYG